MIDQEVIRKKKIAWTRHQSKILSLVQDLENEIQNLRKKGVHPDFIQKKSDQLDLIIESINYADEVIQLLIFAHSSAALEIFCLEKTLHKTLLEDKKELDRFLSKEHTYELVRDMVEAIKTSQA